MESDLQQHPPMFLDHHQQPTNSGLTRYRSAPSSYFSSIIDREFYEHVFNRPSSPETERMLTRFVNSLGGGDADADAAAADAEDALPTQNPSTVVAVKEEVNQQPKDMPLPPINNEPLVLQQQHQQQQQQTNINNYGSSAPQNFYQNIGRPPLPNQIETGRRSASNLIRHGSSPAGLFSNINIESGMSDFFSFLFCYLFIYFISPLFPFLFKENGTFFSIEILLFVCNLIFFSFIYFLNLPMFA